MRRDWTRRDGLLLIVAAVALFLIDGLVALYSHFLFWIIPLLVVQVLTILGVVISFAMFLFGLYALTGRLDSRRVPLKP